MLPLSGFTLTTALLLMGPPPALATLATAPVPFVAETTAGAEAPPSAEILAQKAPTPPVEDGEIVVTGRRHDKSDPMESVNLESFKVTQAVDTAVIRPVAKTYQRILPAPLRDGIRNVLDNLREPVIILNFLLQHKVGRAFNSLGRLAINSTVGVGGLVDVAKRKPFRIARRPNGFADTLGFYGVKTGAFMFLPIVGPTTVRDLIGTTVDRFILPFAVGGPLRNPAVTIPLGTFGALDHRAQFDETLEALKSTPDAYVATREFYLARRQAEIDELRGKGHRVVKPNPDSIKPAISGPVPR